MRNISSVKRTVLAALLVAMCVVLPLAFHSIPNGGSVFLPMHIPVLVCGMICSWPYGLICGLLGPLLSCLITGMPPLAALPAMMIECGVYGLVSGVILRYLRSGKLYLDLYVSLIAAMLAGRLISGVAKALIFSPGITMHYWITASFVTALPGIIVQLVAVPLLVGTLMKLKYLPMRYPKKVVAYE